MFTWNSDCYSHFLKERTQPAIDLAAKIPLEAPDSILDLGCGPGNSTKVLADRFPHAAHLLGVDLSPDMLQHAKAKYPELSFQAFDATCDFETLSTQFDVIFSNACIQWVPDHPRLLRNMQQPYPIQKNGEILFRFQRFFLTATKAAASTGKEDPA